LAFLGEVKSEIKKVRWPTKKEVADSTAVVFIIVILFTTMVALMDIVLTRLATLL